MVHSQDIVFTLYGDYIRHRGGEVWIGSLVELLGLLGLSGQAVHSILSRLSHKGWLKSRKTGRYSFYSLTPKFLALLEEGAQRIFQPRCDPWDGRWHLLTYSIPESKRHLRRRLRKRLFELGIPVCDRCTYHLRGQTEPRCPECGRQFDPTLLERRPKPPTGSA